MKPIRGSYPTAVQLAWRLDGAAHDLRAPVVLCLHGMGMDEDLFALLLQNLFALPCRFLLPRAPHPMPTPGEGRIGASWYAYDGDQERFRRELERAEQTVMGLMGQVEAELGLEPRARIMLGFSQGGYLGAWMALRHPERFAGMIVSGARVKTEWLESEMRAAGRAGFAALLCHGASDDAVKPEAAERSRDALAAAGVEVELRLFDAGHSVGRDQIAAMATWLTARLG